MNCPTPVSSVPSPSLGKAALFITNNLTPGKDIYYLCKISPAKKSMLVNIRDCILLNSTWWIWSESCRWKEPRLSGANPHRWTVLYLLCLPERLCTRIPRERPWESAYCRKALCLKRALSTALVEMPCFLTKVLTLKKGFLQYLFRGTLYSK